MLDLVLAGAVENRRREVEAKRVRRPPEVGLEDLPDVHTRRNAERIQHDLDRRAVRQIRHVLFRQDARDDALVAVAAGHLVADRQLALHRDVDLDQLDDARRQLVAATNLLLLLLELVADDFDLPLGALFELAEILFQPRIVAADLEANDRLVGQLLQDLVGQRVPFFSSRSRPCSSYRSARDSWPCSMPTTRFFTSS